MSRNRQLVLVVSLLLGWLPALSLWLNPPPLIGDEAYYAQVPVEMRERKDWIVPYFNGEPRYKKPPLMYWLVALSQSIFGENEFASRLPSSVAVLLTSLLLLWFGRKVNSSETGTWAAAIFLLNPMTAILGNWGAPEATLCFFVTASVLFGFLWIFNEMSSLWLLLSGAFAGLGLLTKGAPGFVLPTITLLPITVWIGLGQQKAKTRWFKTIIKEFGLWLIACLVVSVPWFIAVGLSEGEKFWQVFLLREHIRRVAEPMEGHRGPIWFYLAVIWLFFLPWSICLPHAFANALKAFRRQSPPNSHPVDFPMAWWAIVVIGLFSLIATKLPHYIFPAFPAFAWLVASQVQRKLSKGEFWLGWVLSLLPLPLAIYGAFAFPEAYTNFLHKAGFSVGMDLKAIGFSVYLVILGVVSVPAVWFFSYLTSRAINLKRTLVVGGAVLTFVSLLSGYTLIHASGGHDAIRFWTKFPNLATFGSDTEWAVFYAKHPVPMFGRNEEKLGEFLTNFSNAAILARVDFAPALRREGLTVMRFGIWCVALAGKVSSDD